MFRRIDAIVLDLDDTLFDTTAQLMEPAHREAAQAMIDAGLAADLAGIVSHVTVLEFSEELKADAVLLRRLESLSNVDVVVHAATTEVLGDGSKVTGVRYDDRVSRESRELSLEGIFVQIGLLPNTEWLDGSVELSKYGEIVVDAKNRTSVPGVFAAGDVTTVPFKQIIIAAGAGANAALGAFDHLIRAEQ